MFEGRCILGLSVRLAGRCESDQPALGTVSRIQLSAVDGVACVAFVACVGRCILGLSLRLASR